MSQVVIENPIINSAIETAIYIVEVAKKYGDAWIENAIREATDPDVREVGPHGHLWQLQAQQFRTGDNEGGYTLSAIQVRVDDFGRQPLDTDRKKGGQALPPHHRRLNDNGETVKVKISNARLCNDASQTLSITRAEATGTIRNSDPLPRALMARFGRTAAAHVVEQVEQRLEEQREPGFRGQMASSVTGLYPWVGYKATDRITLWGVTGYGLGLLSLAPDCRRNACRKAASSATHSYLP